VNPATDEAKRDGEQVQAALLHAALLNKVKAIKSRRGGTIAEIVTTYGGPGIDDEYRRVLDEMHAELGGEG
jgi:hypothetical protein